MANRRARAVVGPYGVRARHGWMFKFRDMLGEHRAHRKTKARAIAYGLRYCRAELRSGNPSEMVIKTRDGRKSRVRKFRSKG